MNRTSLKLVSAAAGFCLAVVADAVVGGFSGGPIEYDTNDPDFYWIAHQLDDARRDPQADHSLDFSLLSETNWRVACLFGGYTDPRDTLPKFGGVISKEDDRRLSSQNRGFAGIGPIEEFEAMVAFVRADNSTHTIHFPDSPGYRWQHIYGCAERPDTVVRLTFTPDPKRNTGPAD